MKRHRVRYAVKNLPDYSRQPGLLNGVAKRALQSKTQQK